MTNANATFYLVRDSNGQLSVAKRRGGMWFVPGHYEYDVDEEFLEIFELVKKLDLEELAQK
jgi:hypothetical protein